MHTGFDRGAPTLDATPASTVFLVSGFAASQRPGMTGIRNNGRDRP